eukprot:2671924-Rhodomonas_salina.1
MHTWGTVMFSTRGALWKSWVNRRKRFRRTFDDKNASMHAGLGQALLRISTAIPRFHKASVLPYQMYL